MALLAPMLGKGKKTYRIAIGEVKQILPTSRGHRVVLRHGRLQLPAVQRVARQDAEKLRDRTGHARGDPESHLVIAAYVLDVIGLAALYRRSDLDGGHAGTGFRSSRPSKNAWSRVSTAQQRCFTKCLRYGHPAGEPLATVILRDTTPHEVALYILPPDAADDERRPLLDLAADSALPAWFWDPLSGETMTLPPRQGRN